MAILRLSLSRTVLSKRGKPELSDKRGKAAPTSTTTQSYHVATGYYLS